MSALVGPDGAPLNPSREPTAGEVKAQLEQACVLAADALTMAKATGRAPMNATPTLTLTSEVVLRICELLGQVPEGQPTVEVAKTWYCRSCEFVVDEPENGACAACGAAESNIVAVSIINHPGRGGIEEADQADARALDRVLRLFEDEGGHTSIMDWPEGDHLVTIDGSIRITKRTRELLTEMES